MVEDLKALTQEKWQTVVVGSGIGGSAAALRLIQHGEKRVLVLERGALSPPSTKQALWKTPIADQTANRSFTPFIGQAVGGSSRLFGMVMERLSPIDFVGGGGGWPGTLAEWEPYFQFAESAFQVTTATVASEFSPLLDRLNQHGFETHALRLASRQIQGCEYCQSRLCQKHCKQDAFSGPLSKALASGSAKLVPDLTAQAFQQKNGSVEAVIVSNGQESFSIRAEKFILAAGALCSPLLLRRSTNQSSGESFADLPAVGHYLMRHLIDLYLLDWPALHALTAEQRRNLRRAKAWGSHSLYNRNQRLGGLQSFGSLPDFEHVWFEMKESHRWLRALGFVQPILRHFVESLFDRPIAASIVEDEPRYENYVDEESGQMRLRYELSTGDRQRLQQMRTAVRAALGPMLYKAIPQADENARLAHACGTCRMGTSAADSVVNSFGKVHHAENLWIADSSVFPSSTGHNPALTIAAHAARMADSLASGLRLQYPGYRRG